ncbi:hypothetical protein Tco_0386674 [Tanacetum coccineum]
MILCVTTQVITVLNGVIHCLPGYLLSFRELPAKVNKARVTMSSATSDVTYTSVYTDSEPGRAFWGERCMIWGFRKGGIPRVIVLGDDGLPLQQHTTDNYVPEPIIPSTIPLNGRHDVSGAGTAVTTLLTHPCCVTWRYITEYGSRGGVDDDDGDYLGMTPGYGMRTRRMRTTRREEGALSSGCSTYRHTWLMSLIPSDPDFISSSTRAEVERLLALMTLPHHLTTHLADTNLLAGVRLARCHWPQPAHSPPLPPSSGVTYPNPDSQDSIPPKLSLMRYEIGESSTARPVRGQGIDYGFVSTVDAEERRQGIRDVGYGIRDTWVDPAEAVPEIAPMTVGEVNTRVVELAELHERDTQDLYALLEDAQDGRSRISQRVEVDTRSAAHQTQLQLQSTLIQTQHQVHETRFHMQQTELTALRETDRRRQEQMVETLRVIRDMRREMSDMQAELLALREQRRTAGQSGPEARIPDHQEGSGDADSHI